MPFTSVTTRTATSLGEILQEEFLKPLSLTANALAIGLRVPANRVTGILKGERRITADTALRLARYFGMSAEFWLNAQMAYDLSRTVEKTGELIEADVRPYAQLVFKA